MMTIATPTPKSCFTSFLIYPESWVIVSVSILRLELNLGFTCTVRSRIIEVIYNFLLIKLSLHKKWVNEIDRYTIPDFLLLVHHVVVEIWVLFDSATSR